MGERITQILPDVLMQSDPSARVSQVVLEVASVGIPTARITQILPDVLMQSNPYARVSQVVLEVASVGIPTARVTQIFAEILVTTGNASYVRPSPIWW